LVGKAAGEVPQPLPVAQIGNGLRARWRRFSPEIRVDGDPKQQRGTAQVIAELVALAKELRASRDRGRALGLSDAEVAFYDAVVQNDAAVMELGDDTLKKIARGLVKAVQESATIDWNLKESVRAAMRAKVRRLLAQFDYPPDKEDRAVDLVIEQAELFAQDAA